MARRQRPALSEEEIILDWLKGDIDDDELNRRLGNEFAWDCVDDPHTDIGEIASRPWRKHGARLLKACNWDGELYHQPDPKLNVIVPNLPSQLFAMVKEHGLPPGWKKGDD